MVTKERIEGPTPHGGVASEAYYQNEDGEAVEKEEATHVEIVELDKNNGQIHRTYASIT